ncbi:MAG: FG-GAP-like repeat-containing protein, partial [Bacteroidota bacterium]
LTTAAGNDVRGLAAGDVDGDGWSDIVVTEESNSRVFIFHNKGLGGTLSAASFDPPDTLNTGNIGTVVVDLDGDGKQDVVSIYSDGFYSWFATYRNISTPGNVDFEAEELFSSINYSNSTLSTVDIDGDGRMDLTASHGNGSAAVDFYVAQNISTPGNIEFAAPRSYFGSATLDAVNTVSNGDLDGDGKPELLVGHSFGSLFSILPNTSTPGVISFGTPIQFSVGVSFINVADLNLDGKNDLMWKGGNPNDIRIRVNTNSGGALAAADFAAEVILTSDLFSYGGACVADINGDGKPDIVATDSDDVGIFENVYTGGTFNSSAFLPAFLYTGSQTSYPTRPVVTDLNGDQKPDVIIGTTNTSPPRLSIFQNVNTKPPVISVNTISPLKGPIGTTVTITGANFSTVPSDNIVHFGEVKASVLTATATALTVEVPSGAGYAYISVARGELSAYYDLPFNVTYGPGITFDGTAFAPPITFTLTTADYDIAVGDIDGDGKPDLLAEGNTVDGYAFRNTHTGGAISASSLTPDDTTSSSAGNPKLVDMDGDGKLDILSFNGLYDNLSTVGDINFGNLVSYGSSGNNISWADFNQDGKTDYVGAATSANLTVFENWTRPGTYLTAPIASFSSSILIPKPAANGGTIAVDFDRDGLPDIAVSNPTLDNISVFRNIGAYRIASSMFTATTFATGDNPGRLYGGDMDSDGKTDIVLYHGTPSQFISVFHNESTPGNITFARTDYTLGSIPTVLTISDLDGDGKPEMVVTSEAADRFSIFKNMSTPGTINASSFAAPVHYTVNNPRGLATIDINMDGKPEIVVNSNPNSMLVYENLIPAAPTISFTTHPATTYACEEGSATFTAVATGTTNITYRWQVFDGGLGSYVDLNNNTTYSGVTTGTLTVSTPGGVGAGDYRAKASGDFAIDAFSNAATLTVNSLPTPPSVFGSSGCVAPASLTIKASGASDGDYRWYNVASGGSVLESDSAFVTPSINATTTFYVSIADAFCESNRIPVDASINLLTKPTVSSSIPPAAGTVSACEGDALILNAPGGFTNYTWSDGRTTSSIAITQAGTYSVIVGSGGCQSPSSDPVTVVINAYPDADITFNGTQLTVSAGDGYQWYSDGSAIVNATSQTVAISLVEYGVYAVDITKDGCTTRSNNYVYLVTGVESFGKNLKVYPNPVSQKLTIEHGHDFKVLVFDEMGRSVMNSPSESKKATIDFSNTATGSYILTIKTGHEVYHVRVIKE